jgi:signal transduction histidine kinase
MTRSILRRVLRPSAAFLASGYIVLGITTLTLFTAPIFYAWHVTGDHILTDLLIKDTQHFVDVYHREGSEKLVKTIQARINMQIAGEKVLLITDAAEHPLAGNIPVWPTNLPSTNGTYTISMPLNGPISEVVVVRTILPNGYKLLVGQDRSSLIPIETTFWLGLAGAGIVLTIIGILGGVFLRRAIMSRVNGVGRIVSAIMQGDLGHRLPTYSSEDELDKLSITINNLLEQIEQLVHGIRNVSNAIAHDLRTPLAELRTRLEALVLTQPSPQETFIEIDAAVADVDGVIRVFNALLRLAEIDAGMQRSGFIQVDITKVVVEAVDFYLPATELKGISLRFNPKGSVFVIGDPILLMQAVSNLIDNALKYANLNGYIFIDINQCNGKANITIADNGPGIPDIEKPKVVDRFFRGSAAHDTAGVGLGLTLVEAVAKLHGGQLVLIDNHPGLKAIVIIG